MSGHLKETHGARRKVLAKRASEQTLKDSQSVADVAPSWLLPKVASSLGLLLEVP